MRRFQKIGGVAVLLLAASCASGPVENPQTISIPYDAYDYDPGDLQAEADAYCNAFDLGAVYEDETVDPTSVRWRYRHYRCE